MKDSERTTVTSWMSSIVTFYLWSMVSEITRFNCKPDLTSSWFLRQGLLYAILHDGFWNGDLDFILMFNWHCLSILNGLDFIRIFVFGWNSQLRTNIWGFWGKMILEASNWDKNTDRDGTSLRWTACFEPLCVKYHYVFGLCRCARKQAGRP